MDSKIKQAAGWKSASRRERRGGAAADRSPGGRSTRLDADVVALRIVGGEVLPEGGSYIIALLSKLAQSR